MREIFPGITADSMIRFGKPVLAGTRVPVELVVGKIGGGMTIEQVMGEYELTREQVFDALRYAARVLSRETVMVS
ncbi:MAG: DUF433 domain-containing protein [bacterium]|nr:DUF433 domain-containing protein [bacterium]